jgi:hypothetical protein
MRPVDGPHAGYKTVADDRAVAGGMARTSRQAQQHNQFASRNVQDQNRHSRGMRDGRYVADDIFAASFIYPIESGVKVKLQQHYDIVGIISITYPQHSREMLFILSIHRQMHRPNCPS